MIALARRRVGDAAAVDFHTGRFEDVRLPDGAFEAVFSATAFHWVDPGSRLGEGRTGSWSGGTLALLMHVGYRKDEESASVEALRGVLNEHLETKETWPPLRSYRPSRRGSRSARTTSRQCGAWLAHHDLQSPDAAELFDNVRFTFAQLSHEQTADEFCELLDTTSSYRRLEPREREWLDRDVRAVIERFGGAIRFDDLAVLVTAKRSEHTLR